MSRKRAVGTEYIPGEYGQTIRPQQRPQAPKKKKLVKKKKSFVARIRPIITRLGAVMVLSVVVIGQHIYINGLGHEINLMKNDIVATVTTNAKLEKQIAALMDLERIEAIAIAEMGMVLPSDNVAYIGVKKEQQATEEKKEVASVENRQVQTQKQSTNGVIGNVEGFFNEVVTENRG